MKHVETLASLAAMVIGGLCIAAVAGCAGFDSDHADPAMTRAEARAERRAKTRAESKRFRDEWEASQRARDERWAKMEADAERERQEIEAELAKNPPKKRRTRRIRRFQWESPAETRGKLWNVPEEESENATLEAFLRVCIAEADGNPQDCVGIWQVVKNNRRRSCSRGMIRRITECIEGEGETFLSALRRHQRHVLGFIKARNKRAVWIGRMTLDCENPPEGFPGSTEDERLTQWDARYQKRCSQTVELGRHLIKGELPPSRPGQSLAWLPYRPITWGGRCESGRAACDDQMACARGLNRIPETDTLNAFWCRPGKRGCPDGIDPICQEYRQKTAPPPDQVETAATESPPSSTPQS